MKSIKEHGYRQLALTPFNAFKRALVPLALFALPFAVAAQNSFTNTPSPGKISGDVSASAILTTMEKVADWQLAQPLRHPPDEWTYGALYTGIMALSRIAGTPKYHDAMVAMGKSFEWKPGRRIYHADDHCVSQMYLELYLQDREPAMLAPTKEAIRLHPRPSGNERSRISKPAVHRIAGAGATRCSWARPHGFGSTKRRARKDISSSWTRNGAATSDFLYDTNEHLYFRDSTYFDKARGERQKDFLESRQWLGAGRIGEGA